MTERSDSLTLGTLGILVRLRRIRHFYALLISESETKFMLTIVN